MVLRWVLAAAFVLASLGAEARDVGVRRPPLVEALNNTFSIINAVNKIAKPSAGEK